MGVDASLQSAKHQHVYFVPFFANELRSRSRGSVISQRGASTPNKTGHYDAPCCPDLGVQAFHTLRWCWIL